jgi:hypothetical protein
VTIRQDADLAPMLKGCQTTGVSQCPHWGYVFSGTLTWRYADREEGLDASYRQVLTPARGRCGLFAGCPSSSDLRHDIGRDLQCLKLDGKTTTSVARVNIPADLRASG